MAYGKKYHGGFYNHHRNPITVELYLDDFVGDSTAIKISDCEMNYQLDGNILTQSVDISLQNTFTFAEFETLLENYEKQWVCKILNDESVPEELFYGFLVVDIQEQSLQDTPSEIRLTFTDHLKRLQDFSPTLVIDQSYSLLNLIKDALDKIDSKDINVNSSLYHILHNPSASPDGTFLEQSYVLSDLFYENNVEIQSAWDILQKIFHDFNLYLYVYKNEYYIERYNDIETTDDWKKIDTETESNGDFIITVIGNKKQEIASTDYHIKNNTGVVAYHSGLSEFELNLDNSERITIAPLKDSFEEWVCPESEAIQMRPPKESEIDFYTWYYSYYEFGDPYYFFIKIEPPTLSLNGYNMLSYVELYPQSGYTGWENIGGLVYIHLLSYKTRITFNETNTILKLNWKIYPVRNHTFSETDDTIAYRFQIRKSGQGAKPDYYLAKSESGIIKLQENTYRFSGYINNTEIRDGYFEVSESLDLTYIKDDCGEDEVLIISFMPTQYSSSDWPYVFYMEPFVIGDVYIRVDNSGLENQNKYDVNSGFVNKQSDDLYLYDIKSLNFNNGVMLSDGNRTTEEWYEKGESFTESLVDKFIKSVVGFNYKTRKEIKGDFIFKNDTVIKPLSLMACSVYVGQIFVVMHSIQWDMRSGVYTISAIEYSDEAGEINIIE